MDLFLFSFRLLTFCIHETYQHIPEDLYCTVLQLVLSHQIREVIQTIILMDLIQSHPKPSLCPTNVDHVFYCTNYSIYHEMRGKYEWWT